MFYFSIVVFLLYVVQMVKSSIPVDSAEWNNSIDVTRVVQFSNSLVPPLFNVCDLCSLFWSLSHLVQQQRRYLPKTISLF